MGESKNCTMDWGYQSTLGMTCEEEKQKEVNQYEILRRGIDWWGRKKRWWQRWPLRQNDGTNTSHLSDFMPSASPWAHKHH